MSHKQILVAASFFTGLAFADVQVQDNLVSANFENITVEAALIEIIEATGVQIETTESLEEKIHIAYPAMPLKTLLNKLLHNYNVSYLTDGNTGDIAKIRIFSQGQAPVISFASNPSTDPTATTLENGLSSPANNALEQDASGDYYLIAIINDTALQLRADSNASGLLLAKDTIKQLGLMGLNPDEEESIPDNQRFIGQVILDSIEIAGKRLDGIAATVENIDETGVIGPDILAAFDIQLSDNGQIQSAAQTPQTQAPQAQPPKRKGKPASDTSKTE
ncbi:hypothetical protein [Ostreibacterium oceani]|uniref:Uncharacterized protein n=1 Tax=Ostreibacterium oceani TaxID=2654998 RepID=A0A6N7EVV9_9GAMM|nr:hypothetical protein [Ostreibacterium oceani]MPV86632.1 hypothetical protein [Ostreibacterium oceani]